MKRKLTVIAVAGVATLVFLVSAVLYRNYQEAAQSGAAVASRNLERPHSPRTGPDDAKVTIVEFLDPACEACRAFYPIVKGILAKDPKDVRLVIRYAPFHEGSHDVARMLEAAKLQGRFWPVLEALFAAQPSWASHGQPNLENAWRAARSAGLEIVKARSDMNTPEIRAIVDQDVADLREFGVEKTPTFFVNGKPLPSFGSDQLLALVQQELKARQ